MTHVTIGIVHEISDSTERIARQIAALTPAPNTMLERCARSC
jgi:hypothetical protein